MGLSICFRILSTKEPQVRSRLGTSRLAINAYTFTENNTAQAALQEYEIDVRYTGVFNQS